MTTQTARAAARHGVKRGSRIRSPYSARWLTVIAARECGCHVLLTTEEGRTLLVDASARLERPVAVEVSP